jgi:phosphoribosylamine--glycine ligase
LVMSEVKQRLLVLGSGGREHAMLHALRTAPDVELYCAPGNAGTAQLATNLDLALSDIDGIINKAKELQISLVIPGPEAILARGISDALAAHHIACCGPSQAAAQLETSKVFLRTLTTALAVPSPHAVVIRDRAALAHHLATWDGLPVLKASGLAGGKGVFLPDSKAQCLQLGGALLDGLLGDAGRELLLEERLEGEEASLFFACHGDTCTPLPHARDHKRLCDWDAGPNTGGMGAISPHPSVSSVLIDYVQQKMILPVLRALEQQGSPFVGFLFAGLMLTAQGPKLLEFNVRFGDPEAQAILPRLASGEFLRLCKATTNGQLADLSLCVSPEHTCAVVLVSAEYPEGTPQPQPITVDEASFPQRHCALFHNATTRDGQSLYSAGGRVLTVVGKGSSPAAAQAHAYQGVGAIHFAGRQLRSDIGQPWRQHPWVSVIMGSTSDHAVMNAAITLLTELAIPHEACIVSAHRTPDWMVEFAKSAESRGIEVIIAGAGGAAHLPGMVASLTTIPVLGVPVPSTALAGLDSLLSIVQMPRGVPVGTLAIGIPGAANAALLAASICALHRPALRKQLLALRTAQAQKVQDALGAPLPKESA